MSASRTSAFRTTDASPCNGLLPLQLTRRVAVQATRLMAALAALAAMGCEIKHVISRGAEQEIVARFSSLPAWNEFQRKFC